MATLVDAARTHLIALGIVRDPRVAGGLPPCWRQPADGVPAPGEGTSGSTEVGTTSVVGLLRSDGIAAPRFEAEFRRDILDVWIRTTKWPETESLYAQLRTAFLGTQFTKTNWTMGTMKVIESTEWRALGLIDSNTQQGFSSMFAVLFETYAPDHF